MIAGCLIGSVYVLGVHRDGPEAETSSAGAVNRSVDWELIKVLVEMDIRNPSPEHEAFLREYNRTQNRCEKGK